MAKKKRWSHTVGTWGSRVEVYERTPGGPLSIRFWDPTLRSGDGGYERRALSRIDEYDGDRRDREAAIEFAEHVSRQLRRGQRPERRGPRTITLGELTDLYLRHRTPDKSNRSQKADRWHTERWGNFLGTEIDPHTVSLREWDAFKRDRRSGAIDAHGHRVEDPDERRPVRTRTVEADLKWLRHVLGWAVKFRHQGEYLMRESPVRGFPIPHETNPRRAVATDERYEATLKVAAEVHPYLPILLALARHTGRRLSAILGLRYEDLRLDWTEDAPWGLIRWPAEMDKRGKEWTAALAPAAREALDAHLRERPGIGPAPIFPGLRDASKPVDRTLAARWLHRAEEKAGLDPLPGALWHAYRRMWATARKDLSLVDVAATGGWSDTQTLQRCYTQPDPATSLAVVLHETDRTVLPPVQPRARQGAQEDPEFTPRDVQQAL